MFIQYIIACMEPIMLNYFDLFVIIVTLGFAVYGFREGLLRGAVKLAGFIAIIVFMVLFSDKIVNACFLIEILPTKISIPLIFIAIFVIASIAFYFLAEILHKLIKITPVRFIDSGLGCMFGILKALFLNGILAILLSFATPGTLLNYQYETSHTGKTLKSFMYITIPYMKSTIISMYQRYIPMPEEQEKKEDEKIILPDVI